MFEEKLVACEVKCVNLRLKKFSDTNEKHCVNEVVSATQCRGKFGSPYSCRYLGFLMGLYQVWVWEVFLNRNRFLVYKRLNLQLIKTVKKTIQMFNSIRYGIVITHQRWEYFWNFAPSYVPHNFTDIEDSCEYKSRFLTVNLR